MAATPNCGRNSSREFRAALWQAEDIKVGRLPGVGFFKLDYRRTDSHGRGNLAMNAGGSSHDDKPFHSNHPRLFSMRELLRLYARCR